MEVNKKRVWVDFGSWDKYAISIYDSKRKLWEEVEEKLSEMSCLLLKLPSF